MNARELQRIDIPVGQHFAVHRVPGDPDYWMVTHVPTGLYLLKRLPNEDLAAVLGDRLHTFGVELGVDWSDSDPKTVLGSIELIEALESERERLLAEHAELMEQAL